VTSRVRIRCVFALLGVAVALASASGCAAGVTPPEEGGDEPASGGTTLVAGGRAGQNGFSVAGSSAPQGGSASGGANDKAGVAGVGGALGSAGRGGAPIGGAAAVAGSSASGASGAAAGGSAAGGSSAQNCATEEFTYAADESLQSVHLSGSFNAWADPGMPLTHEAGGPWTLSLGLAAGNYEYKFVLDGKTWVSDPANPNTANDTFGGVNSVLTVVCP